MDRFVEEFHPESSDVTVCGSMTHKNEWLQVVDRLRAEGLIVATPDLSESTDWSSLADTQIIERKGWLVRRHLANIAASRAVLICNYEKNGIANYIGSNSFLEMGAAFVYNKPLYVLNGIPNHNNREEILALDPIVLNGTIDDFIKEVKQ